MVSKPLKTQEKMQMEKQQDWVEILIKEFPSWEVTIRKLAAKGVSEEEIRFAIAQEL